MSNKTIHINNPSKGTLAFLNRLQEKQKAHQAYVQEKFKNVHVRNITVIK